MTLKARILNYLRNRGDWTASGDIQRLVAENTTFTAQNAGRRLRELRTEGLAEVQYRKGHAYYRATPPTKVHRLIVQDGANKGKVIEQRVYD